MRGFLLSCAAAGSVTFLATQASAQSGVQPATEAATAFDSSRGPGFLLPGVQIDADVDGGKTAQLSLSHISDLPSDNRPGQLELGVTFSAPFDKDTHRGDLVTRGGVPSGFSAEGSVTASIGPTINPHSPPGARDTHYWILHGTIGINVDNFKFRDPLTFDHDHRWRTGVSTSGAIGYMPNGRTFFAVGASYERTYDAPDKRILCQAAAPTPFECTQDVFGPPERSNDASIYGLIRHVRPFGPRIPSPRNCA